MINLSNNLLSKNLINVVFNQCNNGLTHGIIY